VGRQLLRGNAACAPRLDTTNLPLSCPHAQYRMAPWHREFVRDRKVTSIASVGCLRRARVARLQCMAHPCDQHDQQCERRIEQSRSSVRPSVQARAAQRRVVRWKWSSSCLRGRSSRVGAAVGKSRTPLEVRALRINLPRWALATSMWWSRGDKPRPLRILTMHGKVQRQTSQWRASRQAHPSSRHGPRGRATASVPSHRRQIWRRKIKRWGQTRNAGETDRT
jgi:hypothetical protein